MKEFHLTDQPIPEGFRIYAERLEVVGVAHRKQDAQAFVRKEPKWLDFERDPENRHDPNAIRVIGCTKGFFGTKRRLIGFVPREVAKAMVDAKVDDKIRPRLLKTYLGEGGFVEILFQIIGPKEFFPEPGQKHTEREPHYSNHVDRVKWLKAQKRHDEAITLLISLVSETETESRKTGFGVAPWYYEQLAILYRKEKRYDDEVAILERYGEQSKAPGVGPEKLADRLAKAKTLRDQRRA